MQMECTCGLGRLTSTCPLHGKKAKNGFEGYQLTHNMVVQNAIEQSLDEDVAYFEQRLNASNDPVERAKIKQRLGQITSALVLYRIDRDLPAQIIFKQ